MEKIIVPEKYLKSSFDYYTYNDLCGTFNDGLILGKDSVTFDFESDLQEFKFNELKVVTLGDVPSNWKSEDYPENVTGEVKVLEVRNLEESDLNNLIQFTKGKYYNSLK